jgi:YesN/AraC family two-component response regulator
MSDIKVFLVDDNFVARRGLRSVLEAEDGIIITGEASSGSEALKRLRECPAT